MQLHMYHSFHTLKHSCYKQVFVFQKMLVKAQENWILFDWIRAEKIST